MSGWTASFLGQELNLLLFRALEMESVVLTESYWHYCNTNNTILSPVQLQLSDSCLHTETSKATHETLFTAWKS